jgi:DNA mismatch repair protein MutS
MITTAVQKLLDEKNRSLIEVYLDIQKLCEHTYGEQTIVLMEVGSFFEVYGVDNEQMKLGRPKEVAAILNLQLTRKNKTIAHNDVKNPLLAGFPTTSFERYMNRLVQEKKYTIVIIGQKGAPPHVTRHLDRIVSPGVNIDYTQNNEDNFITSILVEKNKELFSIGYSAVDVTTGKTYLFEIHSTKDDPTYALDELFSLIQTHTTSEIIITCATKDIDETYIRKYLELEQYNNVLINAKRLNVNYQNELFKQTYVIRSFLSPIEWLDLERKPLTCEALALLIEFIIEHDYKVIQKLDKPTHLENTALLYLGNNPLEQLNIISRDPREHTVFDLVNKTATSIGKRLLKNRLLNPIISKKELDHRYDLVETLSPHYEKIDEKLRHIYDLERISRRIRIGRLHPFEINFLYDSLTQAEALIESLEQYNAAQLLPTFTEELPQLKYLISHLEQTFDFTQTNQVNAQHIHSTLFQTNYNKELDELLLKKEQEEASLNSIRQAILNMLEEVSGRREENYVQIKQLEKEGHHICMTKSRYYLIEALFEQRTVTVGDKVLPLKSFRKKIQTGNVKITADIIEQISEQIVVLQQKIIALTKELFAKELTLLDEKFHETLLYMTNGISQLDVAISTAKVALQYNFTRPHIVETTEEERIFEAIDIRHPLIELRENNGIYVPNTLLIGNQSLWSKEGHTSVLAKEATQDIDGILLYGINSSGKSSLMKSVGIAVILAQAGLFVPAKQLRFSLYTKLFTRIVAKDNIEKGLSSFAVEMMELKNIFNRSTAHSLILGDEISHGTETLSAIAIVSATIERLSQTGALFLFTTHLHQLHNLSLLKKTPGVISVHLSVHYDKESDTLIFDRALQAGSGSSIYGLEFAQSLHMDEEFLKIAKETRKALAHDYDDLELLTKRQTSKYNKKVFLTSCAICKSKVTDTHHITPQHVADSQGNIGHFHKNHKHNLLPICKSCHDKIHTGTLQVRGFIMTNKGLELSYEEVK